MSSARRRVFAGVPPVQAGRPVAATTAAAELPGGRSARGLSSRNQRAAPRSASCRRPWRSSEAREPEAPRGPPAPRTGPTRSGRAYSPGRRGSSVQAGCGLRYSGPIASARATAGAGSHPARPALPTASLAAAHPPNSAPPPAAAAVRRVNIPASPRRGRAAAGPSPRPHPAPEPTLPLSRELGCASLMADGPCLRIGVF